MIVLSQYPVFHIKNHYGYKQCYVVSLLLHTHPFSFYDLHMTILPYDIFQNGAENIPFYSALQWLFLLYISLSLLLITLLLN